MTRDEQEKIMSLSMAAGQLSDDLMQWVQNAEARRDDHAERFKVRAIKTARQIHEALS